MTWLDVVCGLGLAVIAAGGYAQGLIRGALRLAALVAGGLLGAGLMLRLGTMGTPRATAGWAAAAELLGIAIAGMIAWSASAAVPHTVHQSLPNRVLGVVPALVAGSLVLALGLSLGERVTPSVAVQQLIRAGALTGPLVDLVDTLEQRAVGLP